RPVACTKRHVVQQRSPVRQDVGDVRKLDVSHPPSVAWLSGAYFAAFAADCVRPPNPPGRLFLAAVALFARIGPGEASDRTAAGRPVARPGRTLDGSCS